MGNREATNIALDLFRSPAMAPAMRSAPLPKGMLTLIRIAAGSETETATLVFELGRSSNEVREAAAFFLQQVLFHRKSDDFRLLGLSPGASPEQIREHKRWLLKWLHPDRNHNKWESALFQRVVKAAENLEQLPGDGTRHLTQPRAGRPRRLSRRSLRKFALRRVREPLFWRARLWAYTKRLAVASVAIVMGMVVWGQLKETPLRTTLSDLAGGSMAWLQW